MKPFLLICAKFLPYCIIKVLYKIIRIFDAYAEPDQGIGKPVLDPLLLWDRGMGHGSWMVDQGFNAPQAFGQGK